MGTDEDMALAWTKPAVCVSISTLVFKVGATRWRQGTNSNEVKKWKNKQIQLFKVAVRDFSFVKQTLT